MTAQPLLIEERDGVLILTLNRPDVRNAINAEISEALGRTMEAFDDDPRLSVAILTGGPEFFSSGKDLNSHAYGPNGGPVFGEGGFAGITRKIFKKPLIAAVEGFAVAGGFEIALSCDMIVASKTAYFGLPEVKRGLVAGAGALLRLPRRVPYYIAMEMALTGDFVDAERLYGLGLVNRLAEPGAALDTAITLARKVMEGAPIARENIKQVVIHQQDWSLQDMWINQDPYFRKGVGSEDAKEGALAFKEKRAPVWSGK